MPTVRSSSGKRESVIQLATAIPCGSWGYTLSGQRPLTVTRSDRMVTYEVTCEVEADRTAAFERFMRERHIPELLATGCFQGAELLQSAPGRYQVRYHAATPA